MSTPLVGNLTIEDQHRRLKENITKRRNALRRIDNNTLWSPYVMSMFGWAGTGKSALINTIMQVLDPNDLPFVLENDATTLINDKRQEGTWFPKLFSIQQEHLYVVDHPGWKVKYTKGDFSVVDKAEPLKNFKEHMYNTGTVCRDGYLEGTIPGVAIVVYDARECMPEAAAESSGASEQKVKRDAKGRATADILQQLRKDIDVVVALTHWDELPTEKDVIRTASKILGVDDAHIFPISNYVGTVRDGKTIIPQRTYERDLCVLKLIYSTMGKIDQSAGIVKRLLEGGIVKVPYYDLEITSARYYARGERHLGRDVTKEVTDKLASPLLEAHTLPASFFSSQHRIADEAALRRLVFTVSNKELGGDPARGYKKSLEITYMYRFQSHTVTYREGEVVALP